MPLLLGHEEKWWYRKIKESCLHRQCTHEESVHTTSSQPPCFQQPSCTSSSKPSFRPSSVPFSQTFFSEPSITTSSHLSSLQATNATSNPLDAPTYSNLPPLCNTTSATPLQKFPPQGFSVQLDCSTLQSTQGKHNVAVRSFSTYLIAL